MPYAQTPDKYSMYVPQGSKRSTFSHFSQASIDAFASPGSQNENGFLDLLNVLPSVTGGFQRRWGLTNASINTLNSNYRMFPYQVSAEGSVAGVYYSGFANYYSFLATDNQVVKAVYNEGTNDGQEITGFSGTGQVYATTSRDFLYAFDGVDLPQKKHFAILTDTQTNIGFDAPTITSFDPEQGTGINYNPGTTTATFSGSGSGATFSLSFTDGYITGVTVTAGGTGYGTGSGVLTVVDTSGGGSGATIYVALNDAVTEAILGGGLITLQVGRQYAFAFQNSKTGHTSDVTFATPLATTPNANDLNNGNPVGVFLVNTITIPTTLPDPQIDTVVIMATADGQDQEHLYQVQIVPLSAFTVSGGSQSYLFVDQLPDSYTDTITTGDTLLSENLWVDLDSSGNTVGLINNEPAIASVNKPVGHQGRLFVTDGKTVFFSKSLAEVTTSTGLITSKWEEAWPANNRLDIGFDNEVIVGLLSDTTFLYIGTTQNIYRLSGTDGDSFDLQCIFRNVGLQSQDCWTVVYKEDLPAGYLWITPDSKVIFSDFNNYEDIGNPIYPIIQGATVIGIQPWVHGPYPMAFVRLSNNQVFVLNLSSNGWFSWEFTIPNATLATGAMLTYVKSTGLANLWLSLSGSTPLILGYLDPTKLTDDFPSASTGIGWAVQTGWQDLGDTTNVKVINEVESWSSDVGPEVVVYSKSGSSLTPVSNAKASVLGPIAILRDSYKAYFAGVPTGGKFFSFSFGVTSGSTNSSPNVLDQFVVEHFPFGRF